MTKVRIFPRLLNSDFKESEKVLSCRKRKKLEFIERLGGECQKCGYNKCENALEFHHLDAEKKDKPISKLIADHSFEKALKEIKKCILVCSNCHREIHHKEQRIDIIFSSQMRPREWFKIECEWCKNEFETTVIRQKYCSQKCSKLAQRKVKNRPDKDELEQLISEFNWTELGKKFIR